MKKRILLSVLTLLSFSLYFACTDEKVSDSRERGGDTFSKEEAKKFFETRATNLRSLSFEKESASRSMENNTPEWDKAQTYVTDQSVIVEVPIFSPGSTRVYQREHGTDEEKTRITMAFKKLIVAQRNGGNTEMFVVTFIPDCLTPRFVHNMDQNLRYYGGTFSGLLFCSDLDGGLRAGFRYINGVNKGHLEFTYKDELGGRMLEEGEVSFRMQDFVTARSFGDDESFAGSGSMCKHGNDPFTCPECTSIPEVVVKFCKKCKTQTTGNEPCLCCPWCKEYPCKCPCPWCGYFPCRCPERCSQCGKIPCAHPCDYCGQLYCHGQCKYTGGGSGSGNPGVNPDNSLGLLDGEYYIKEYDEYGNPCGLSRSSNCVGILVDTVLAKKYPKTTKAIREGIAKHSVNDSLAKVISRLTKRSLEEVKKDLIDGRGPILKATRFDTTEGAVTGKFNSQQPNGIQINLKFVKEYEKNPSAYDDQLNLLIIASVCHEFTHYCDYQVHPSTLELLSYYATNGPETNTEAMEVEIFGGVVKLSSDGKTIFVEQRSK